MQTRLFGFLLLTILFAGVNTFAQTNILFVGNSLTYSDDLPLLVRDLAREDGVTINTQMIAFPNYALEDHWNETNVSDALKKTKFDYVIFQQGPSAMPDSRTNLLEYALKFSELCKANNTRMCMYTVWPSRERYFDLDNVIKSYALAADTTAGVALQAGLAWKKILESKKDFPLCSADGFHPSMHGSFLSAMVIYGTLFKKNDFEFLTLKNVPSKQIRQTDLELMKRIALECARN